ncbi:MAG: diaminopimelate epimerase [Clostridia bacterium]
MELKFTKMHGIGNDYIYFNCLEKELDDPNGLSMAMSPRHFSVGADGIVMICHSDIADAKMRMFNLDGSEGKMCGNAIRCVGKYLYDNKLNEKTNLSIETLSGTKYLTLNVVNNKVASVMVDMGTATLEPKEVPVIANEKMISTPVMVKGKEYKMTAVSVGNPHSIIFVDDVDSLELDKIGSDFENLAIFPERVNTEFVRVIDRQNLQMRVWERGSGETYACGTGSCATVVAAVVNGYCDYDTPVIVHLIGGNLKITVTKDLHMFMEGTATKVYEGVYNYEY